MKTKRTKITALVPDDLLQEVLDLTAQRTTTDALIAALSEWVAQHRIQKLTALVGKNPLYFADGVTAKRLREVNRRRRA